MLIQKAYVDYIEKNNPQSIVLLYLKYATLYTLESNGKSLEAYDFSVANHVYCRDTESEIMNEYRLLLNRQKKSLEKQILTPIKVGDKIRDTVNNIQYTVIKVSPVGLKLRVKEDKKVHIEGNIYFVSDSKGEEFNLSRRTNDVIINQKKKYLKYEAVKTDE